MKQTFFKIKNYQREKSLKKIIKKIDRKKYSNLSDKELKEKAFKEKNNIENLLSIISESVKRTLNIEPYDVQLMAAISIAINGYLVEMKTGEGKTLTAGISALIKAIRGHKTFVITVNDYLSKRDLESNKELFDFFGITSSVLQKDMNVYQRQESYAAQIVYGTSSEFAFDYLRDNTVNDLKLKTFKNRVFDSVIIDEIDSVLIDEASTPLIISGQNKEQNNALIFQANSFAKKLSYTTDKEDSTKDVFVEYKSKTALLTEQGIAKAEEFFKIDNLYAAENMEILHRVEQAIVANFVYEIEKDYIIHEGAIVLVDQGTGRLSFGRQLSFGLHQALEAKEQLALTFENVAIAKITYQNFFKKFEYLSGMTGTAKTEEEEFLEIYGLEIIVIPTHKPMIRKDLMDRIFINKNGKTKDLVKIVKETNKSGQPILIGTTTVEENEYLSEVFKKEGIKFSQLNAKNAEEEAEIISHAGEFGRITLATNMAGRGVDIKLTEESRAAGGLFVIGFGRYENRRVDNQLRGRSGRQGDPGKSIFLVSLEDDIVKNFAGSKIMNLAKNLDISENDVIESKMISNAIEKAQKAREDMYFEIRKHLVEYDSVLSSQRDKIYEIRDNLLTINDRESFLGKIKESILEESKYLTYIDYESLSKELLERFNIAVDKENYPKNEEEFISFMEFVIFNKFMELPEELSVEILKDIYISILDKEWSIHLTELETYQEGVGSVKLANKDPLVEYQKKGFEMFNHMIIRVRRKILYTLFNNRYEIVHSEINEKGIE